MAVFGTCVFRAMNHDQPIVIAIIGAFFDIHGTEFTAPTLSKHISPLDSTMEIYMRFKRVQDKYLLQERNVNKSGCK
jgi:hypothetical protein